MSKFASRENSLTEQRMIGRELEALLGAVEVTGLSGWERAKKLHGGLAEGEISMSDSSPAFMESARGPARPTGEPRAPQLSPSASPAVQQHLFEGEEAA